MGETKSPRSNVMATFIINEQLVTPAVPEGASLLDTIREHLHLCGTKQACREGECGACTVLIGKRGEDGAIRYKASASCLLPVGDVDGCHVVTVEGLGRENLTVVQQLIVEHGASQCGFCTPGIVLSLTGFCLSAESFTDEGVLNALDGNLCRCTGYVSIRAAARGLVHLLCGADLSAQERVPALVSLGVLPTYFLKIPQRIATLQAPTRGSVDPDAVLVAGGTDLFVQRSEALREAPLCFLSHDPDLLRIEETADALRVGGAVTLEDFRMSPAVARHFPTMKSDLLLHSSSVLRNKATLAGNVVNASPIGDMTIMLLALDARLVLESKQGLRETPLSAFFLGYKKTDLACGERVREIVIPYAPGSWFHFEKVSNRKILDIAAVNTAILIRAGVDGTLADMRLSVGGVAPIPLLIPGLDALMGRSMHAGMADAVVQAATGAAKPIDDIRGTAAYKKLLLEQLVRAHFAAYRTGGQTE